MAGVPASGLVVVDKPAQMTSHDVVARVRRLAGTRKVGHAGTLDPMATGVLLVGVNKATRLLGHLALSSKTYEATIRLGVRTVTDDAEGDVVARVAATDLDERQVREAASGFVGDLDQVPAAVSAVKTAGRRAYERVRAGESVDLPPRRVTVHALEISSVERVGDVLDVAVCVRCSSGTYMRAIARDLGDALGVGGHLSALRRTAVGVVTVDEATPLGDLEQAGSVPLLPLGEAAARFLPTRTVEEQAVRDVAHGRPLDLALTVAGPVAVLGPDGALLALYRRSAKGERATPVAVLV